MKTFSLITELVAYFLSCVLLVGIAGTIFGDFKFDSLSVAILIGWLIGVGTKGFTSLYRIAEITRQQRTPPAQ